VPASGNHAGVNTKSTQLSSTIQRVTLLAKSLGEEQQTVDQRTSLASSTSRTTGEVYRRPMLSQQRFPQGSCYAMTGYQAVLLARRSGPGQVIRFANAMMCHIRDREGTVSFIARNDRVTLRSQTSLFDYKAIYSTCRNRRSRRLRPRCVPQLEPRGDILGASSHRYRPLSSSTFRGGHRARGRDQRVRG